MSATGNWATLIIYKRQMNSHNHIITHQHCLLEVPLKYYSLLLPIRFKRKLWKRKHILSVFTFSIFNQSLPNLHGVPKHNHKNMLQLLWAVIVFQEQILQESKWTVVNILLIRSVWTWQKLSLKRFLNMLIKKHNPQGIIFLSKHIRCWKLVAYKVISELQIYV